MTNIVLDISMSLDGYVRAPNANPQEPLGEGGHQLHEWAFGQHAGDREILEGGGRGTGAIIAGRRTYDDSIAGWGADGPSGAARLPVIVVSHDQPRETPENGVYTFTTSIETALAEARPLAGEKSVCVMGGADIAQQCLKADLIDEVSIHLVPVLFGGGARLFEHLGDAYIQLENVAATQTPAATHLRFRVIR